MKQGKTKLCYPRTNREGEIISYRFFYNGRDPITGRPKQYTQTWKVPRGLTHREIELERKKAELEFIKESEKKSDGTFVQETHITFEEFANEWLKNLMVRNGEAYSYFVRAKASLKILNDYFGRYQLRQISPSLVQRFYDFLCERTYTKEIVTVKRSLFELMEQKGMSKAKTAEACGIDRLTLRTAARVGERVSMATAKAIVKHFGVPLDRFFLVEKKEVKYSKDTNAGIRSILVVILGEAKRQQLIEHNYATKDYTKPLVGTTKRKEIFDEEEARDFVRAVLKEPNPKKRAVFALLIFTGLRKAEICGLSWDNIDFENGTLRVEKNTLYFKDFGIVTKGTKTETSKRTISLPEQMIAILREYRDWYLEQREGFGDLWADTNMLFLQESGKPMNPCTVNAWLKKFNLEHGFKPIPPHAMRHTCITMQINAGIPIKTVSARAGHANERITLDVYTHALQSQDVSAATLYNKYLLM